MNKEMQKRLMALISSDILVSIFDDPDEPNSSTLGYLLQMDNYDILINILDIFGEEDGFCTISLNNIIAYDEDKMYSEKMKKLFSIKNQKRRYISNSDSDSDPIINLLKYAEDNNFLIEVNDDDNYIGFVSYFSTESLVLKIIDNYCNDIGTTTIDMGYINKLSCENRYLKDLELLYSKK